MGGFIEDMVQRGTPFFVSIDLGQAANNYTAVRTPRVNQISVGQPGGDQLNDFRIVLTGYHYDYVADAATEGFDLVWAPDHSSPTPSPGGTVNRFAEVRSQAAARVEGGWSGFLAAGPGGIYSPIKMPSDLVVLIVGTPLSGHVNLSGYLCGGDKMMHSYTASPDLFTLTPAVP